MHARRNRRKHDHHARRDRPKCRGDDDAAQKARRNGCGQRSQVAFPRSTSLGGDADAELKERHTDNRERNVPEHQERRNLGVRSREIQVEQGEKEGRKEQRGDDEPRHAAQLQPLNLGVKKSQANHRLTSVSVTTASSRVASSTQRSAKTMPFVTIARTSASVSRAAIVTRPSSHTTVASIPNVDGSNG